jgi:DNA-binding transcriptional LysR family regulator
VDLVAERFDVAIRAGALQSSGMVVRRLASLDRPLYASPDYLRAAGTPRSPADLAQHCFVMLEAHVHPRPEVDLVHRGGRKVERVTMQGPIVSNSLGMVRALTIAGGGIGFIPARMCAEDAGKGHLIRVLPAWAARPIDFHYVISSRKLLPAGTRLFVEELVAHFDALSRAVRPNARNTLA